MNEQQLVTRPPEDERRGGTSASNAEYDLLCAGRFLAQRGKEEKESDDAAHGRVIHHALATGDTSKLSIEQHDIYESCVTIENKLIANLFPELAEGTNKQQLKVWRETRIYCGVPPNKYLHSGMPDVVYRVGTRAVIFEYKTLAGDIPSSPTNLQLRDQAVLVRGHLIVPEIAVAVIQPLVTHSPEICFYGPEDLKRSEDEMFARVNASYDPGAKRTPGEAQCKYCLAKRDCAEYQKFAGSMVPNMLSILDVPVSAWTPQQKAQFLDRAPIAKKWLEDGIDEMKRTLKENPAAIPGYGLKEGATREMITNPQAVYERFSELGGTADQFLQCVKVTKSELKEQVGAVTKAKGKTLNSHMETLLEGLVEVKQNEPSIVKVEPQQQ